jgi:membrane-bound lytic murein transglycosylase B
VGILGVETIYGKNMGSFPARDVIATLAFDYPEAPNKAAREILFRNQLDSLISFCSLSESLNDTLGFKKCLKQPSSFAGAIGMPQFMPSSLLQYAIDGNSDGVIDLRNSPEDAMASIANFLVQHGWVANEPILLPVENNPITLKNILDIADGDPNPKWTLSQLKDKRILNRIPVGLSPDTPALIVDLPIIDTNNKESTTYWIGLKNFEVITQYNRSFFYAMSVTEFGYHVGNLMANTSSNPTQATTLNSSIQEKLPLIGNDRHGHRRRIR